MLPKSLISADSHVVERQNAFTDIDPKFRNRIPYETETPELGAALVIEGMLTMGYGRSVGAGLPLQKLGKKLEWTRSTPPPSVPPRGWTARIRAAGAPRRTS